MFIFKFSSEVPKRHKKSLKISVGLFLVFILSFTPGLFAVVLGGKINSYMLYAANVNNLANFFIYPTLPVALVIRDP